MLNRLIIISQSTTPEFAANILEENDFTKISFEIFWNRFVSFNLNTIKCEFDFINCFCQKFRTHVQRDFVLHIVDR